MNLINARIQCNFVLSSLLLSSSVPVHAGFEPLALSTNSYNQDIIVEKTAPPPLVPVTTASMEQGVTNAGFSWFERGYVPDWPVTGLPAAGSVFTSLKAADHRYQMPPSYLLPNAVLIDNVRSNGTITFKAPQKFATLSFLTSSGVAANSIRYTVWYGANGSESGTFVSPNWYGGVEPAWATSGCVDVNTFVHADITSYDPRLYSLDVKLTNVLGAVTRVDLTLASGRGHTVIFAVSGAVALGDEFLPIEISGYDEDMVVEASAVQPGYLLGSSTATMDDGAANTRFTWYEKGYYSLAPETGLPGPGSLITSESQPDHRFVLPPNYREKNAILLDANRTNALITLLNATRCSALSFLTAAGHGPVRNECVIGHANGVFETNSFVVADWLGSEAGALTAHGRVSVSTKLADRINTESPRLYAVDLPVADTNSPVSKIILSFPDAKAGGHAIVLAVSAAAPGTILTRPSLSILASSDGYLTIRSSQPGRLQSCPTPSGAIQNWKDEGAIEQSLTLAIAAGEPARFYRVVSGP